MSMNGIDTSSYQAALNLPNINYDFIVTKATEGDDYVNPYCDVHFQQAKGAGKKRGVYHFIDFDKDIIKQADFFVDNTVGYIRDAVFVLDWEGVHVDRVQDALTFLRRVRDRIGYNPGIYMSEWVENHYDWSPVVAEDFSLWIAKYSDYEIDNNYDMGHAGELPNVIHWDFYFMWQWTSKGRLGGYAGDLDCNIAYIDGAAWDKYAGIQSAQVPPVVINDPLPPVITTTTTRLPEPFPEPTTTTTTTSAPTTTTTTTAAPEDLSVPIKRENIEAAKTVGRNGILAAVSTLIAVVGDQLLNLIMGFHLSQDLLIALGGVAYATLLFIDKKWHENAGKIRGLIPF